MKYSKEFDMQAEFSTQHKALSRGAVQKNLQIAL